MKKIKMVVYGEPGVGKSVFACQAPKPFFICTDGNYEWLEDWGAKEQDHVQVYTWEQAKKAFAGNFEKYETVVVDLTEDLFKWCEFEWCQKNGLTHVGDLGFGKGYDITRNEFFIEISKLLALDKNIILIMHGLTTVVKDRRGVEYTKYAPSNRLPDKVIDMIEGRVRYFIRAFARTEEDADGNLITNRYLSLSPDGTTEFGITRGLSTEVPRSIPLDWNVFYALVTKPNVQQEQPKQPVDIEIPKITKTKQTKKVEVVEEQKLETVAEQTEKLDTEEVQVADLKVEQKVEEPKVEQKIEEPKAELKPQAVSNEDRIAAIKAKLAALKNNK